MDRRVIIYGRTSLIPTGSNQQQSAAISSNQPFPIAKYPRVFFLGDALYTHAPDALAAGHAMYRGPFLAASKRPCVQEREEDMAMCAACTHPISPSAVEQGRASILSADAMSTICPDVRSAVGEGGAAVWTDAVAVFLCTSAATCKKHALEARVSPPTEIPTHCVWKKAWRAAALEVIPEPAVKFDAHIWFEDVHDLSNSSLRAKRKRDSELPEDKILRLVKSGSHKPHL